MIWIDLQKDTENILGMGSANESRHYIITLYLIGWAHTQNDPWGMITIYIEMEKLSIWLPYHHW